MVLQLKNSDGKLVVKDILDIDLDMYVEKNEDKKGELLTKPYKIRCFSMKFCKKFWVRSNLRYSESRLFTCYETGHRERRSICSVFLYGLFSNLVLHRGDEGSKLFCKLIETD